MPYDPHKHHRRSIRLRGYDYSTPGAYFVTIVAHGRLCLFGDVVDGALRLNEAGRMVERVWQELAHHYVGVELDAFIVMPNHVHGIIVLTEEPSTVGAARRACPDSMPSSEQGQPQGVAPTLSLPDLVHRFKSLTTALYRRGVAQDTWPPFERRVWQRNYHDRIVRGPRSLHALRTHIERNPLRWSLDAENPANP